MKQVWLRAVSISFLITASSFSLFSGTAYSQAMPSQAQIEQLRSLPRAQQEQLARQFGVDLQMLDRLEQEQGSSQRDRQDTDVVFPRGTEFDRYGEPVLPENLERQFTRDEEDELKPFGYEMFAGQPQSFAPTAKGPVPSTYIIGPGDQLRIQLFGQESELHDLEVNREGKIVLPRLGELSVAGLTYSAMVSLVQHRVSERLIGTQAAVSMGDIGAVQVFVVGESYQPGAYTVSSLATISQALYVSGGFSEIASLRNISLMRGGEIASEFDMYDMLIKGDTSADVMLQNGDVVFIPPRGPMVAIEGEVTRPALYELKGSETFSDILTMAGGAKPEAHLSGVQVQRVRSGRRQASTFNLESDSELSRQVQGGDRIRIDAATDTLDEGVMVVGAVSRPGMQQWREGMHINDVLTSSRHDLLEQADLSYGLLVREVGARRELKLIQFDVALAIEGHSDENLKLEERDHLIIFGRYETREQEELNISRLTLSRQEREKEHRKRLLAQYRRAFLEDLVSEKQGDKTEEEEENERRRETEMSQQLFGTLDEDELRIPEQELSDFSRKRLLAPIVQRLRSQRTDNGNTPFVYIAGEVNQPGIYPLVENATAGRLVAAAGGLRDSAYLQRAEVTRVDVHSGEASTDYISFDLLDVILGNTDVPLQGRDRLNILSIPEWQGTYEVTLRGEVRFPGTYSIRRGETLTQLIERAGGMTDFAFTEGAVFTRNELRRQERDRVEILANELQREIASNAITGTGGSNQPYSEMRTLLADLLAVEPVGRMIIDLPSILDGRSTMGDIQLKNGDTLHIPSQRDSVSILGEVQMAMSYRFDRELSVRDYIEMSGGTKKKADTDRIYVVRANGAIEPYRQRRGWFSSTGSVRVRPGDAIIVPLDTTYMENLQLWSQVTGIIYNSAVALAAISNI